MTGILEGQRFWKHGDHSHIWVVDAIVPAENGHPPFAVLVNEDGRITEDVDLWYRPPGEPEPLYAGPVISPMAGRRARSAISRAISRVGPRGH